MVNPIDVFSDFRDASSFAKERSAKIGRPLVVRQGDGGWGVFESQSMPTQRDVSAQKPVAQSDSVWSDGRPIETNSFGSTGGEWQSGATGIKSDYYHKENGQPGDYRPENKPVCFLCGGRGTGHGGRACSGCHGYGYMRN
jgi:hypothetical protein